MYLGPQFYLIGVCNYFGTNNVLYFISMALCFDLNLGIMLFPTVFFFSHDSFVSSGSFFLPININTFCLCL